MRAKIKTILIANRGEIARRIQVSCRNLGIRSIALYTEDEITLPHVTMADECWCLPTGELKDNYLNSDLIIAAAKATGADAIHPGYGFLSENADFARKVEKAGLIFIGPQAETISLMGDKIASRTEMEALKIPVVPGYHRAGASTEELQKEAEKLGFPLVIKAAAGGGGRGMALVENASECSALVEKIKIESEALFGDAHLFLERHLSRCRHIEVQVLADHKGNALHFHERDCSIQRRHQKVIEECPALSMSAAVRKKLYDTAVRITKGISYRGAGTIEFLLQDDGEFYFLEMNTRIQVEHGLTEMVMGVDLIEWQIRIANGEKLPFQQKDIIPRGHAIEARIYAEDPDNNFFPTGGKMEECSFESLPQTRWDTGYISGNTLGTHYDPMVGKLLAWDTTREAARLRLLQALDSLKIKGIVSNKSFIRSLLEHTDYIGAKVDTQWLEREDRRSSSRELEERDEMVILAALEHMKSEHSRFSSVQPSVEGRSPWEDMRLRSFRNT